MCRQTTPHDEVINYARFYSCSTYTNAILEIMLKHAKLCIFSLTSSKSPSLESISSAAESVPTTVAPSAYPVKRVNVNSANIFDLMTVPGINQALAARIVNYRDKKGMYKSVDDLKRVGISYKRLGAVKMYLTTYETDSDRSSAMSNLTPGTPASVARLAASSRGTH